jgi:uncharacterized protein YidB (DUF937 family)
MDLISNLKNAVGQALAPNLDAANLASAAQKFIDSQGGLAGLVQNFQNKGLSGIVNSWVATGPNLPISAEQIKSVVGEKTVHEIAGAVGKNPDELLQSVSTLLPALVDHLTPNGQVNQ